MNKKQYRVPHPELVDTATLREWCKKNLNGRVKTVYQKKYDEKKKKWVRDYNEPIQYRFQHDEDALAFKLKWIE